MTFHLDYIILSAKRASQAYWIPKANFNKNPFINNNSTNWICYIFFEFWLHKIMLEPGRTKKPNCIFHLKRKQFI